MIYLIDDDKSIRLGFGMFLKSKGYKYSSIESSDDFIPLFKPVHGDVIVLDLSIPGIHGCDMLKKVYEACISIPVIVVTSLDESYRRECCKQYGVKAYLRKPVDPEALMDIINFNLKH